MSARTVGATRALVDRLYGYVPANGALHVPITGGEVLPNLTNNVQSSGIPGLASVPEGWIIYNATTSSTEGNPNSVLRVDRLANYSGGTGTLSTIRARNYVNIVSGTVDNFEWSIIADMHNYSTSATQQAGGILSYARRHSVGGSTLFGAGITVEDVSGGTGEVDPANAMHGVEIDLYASGTDANNKRSGILLIIGTNYPANPDNSGYTKAFAEAAIKIGPTNSDSSKGQWNTILKSVGTGIDGIDLTGMTLTGSAWKSDGATIDKDGNATLNTTTAQTETLTGSGAFLTNTAAAGTNRAVQFNSGSTARWQIRANSTAESGSDVGSDFAIHRYSDAGSNIQAALTITRSNGAVAIPGALGLTGALTYGGVALTAAVTGTGRMVLDTDPTIGGTLAASVISATSSSLSSNSTFLTSTGTAGNNRVIQFNSGSTARWQLRNNSTAESGSDVGSDFAIHRYSDAGSNIQAALTITRSTGAVAIPGVVSIGNTVNSVSPTAPNRTVTMVVNGVTLYLHAKTSND